MLKKRLAILSALGLLLALSGTLRGTTVERLSLDDLALRSRAIVQGTVLRARTYWSPNGKLILTGTTIEVSESIKGAYSRTVEVTTVGGQIGDTILHVAGMPVFAPGENAIVFVEQSGAYLTVFGLGQGKFTVKNGEVANVVSDLSFPDGGPGRVYRMSVQSFKNEVRSIVDRQR